jgi:hypothetical protein
MRSRVFVLLLVPILAGCGSAKGTVSGRVLYKGAALPGGRVTFRPANPKVNAIPVELDEEGKYEVTLPVGEVRVSVDNRELQPPSAVPRGVPAGLPPEVQKALAKAKTEAAPPPAAEPTPAGNSAAPPKPRGKYVPIPDKYYTIENSDLKFTVEPGNQKHDLELK